jgi:hypothetical protein
MNLFILDPTFVGFQNKMSFVHRQNIGVKDIYEGPNEQSEVVSKPYQWFYLFNWAYILRGLG